MSLGSQNTSIVAKSLRSDDGIWNSSASIMQSSSVLSTSIKPLLSIAS
uniref:Uncharacterized protein n=1 Tax=Arundo donax TaxID=35708 RepID=A0A0A9AIR5_ARUDO